MCLKREDNLCGDIVREPNIMDKTKFDKTINPYKMLNVPENYTLESLKAAYKKAAFAAHPDKGGTEYMFNIVTMCYKYLAKELKKKESDKLHHELKRQHDSSSSNNQQPSDIKTIFYNGARFDQQKFNKFFDDNKFKQDEQEIGYEEWMRKYNVKTTPEFKGGGVSQFNEHFEKNVKVSNQQRQLIKWQEPQPIVACNKLVFSELGNNNVDDFSGENRSIKELNYMDYKIAHTTSRIIDPSTVKRQSFANIQELEQARGNLQYQMSEKDAYEYAKRMNSMKALEQKRKENLEMYDRKLALHYQRINGLISNQHV